VKKMFNRRAQNVAEYSILIALVVGAAVAMQVYVKRGMQGRLKNAVDHTGESAEVGGSALKFTGEQYEPYYQDSEANVKSDRNYKDKVTAGGALDRTGIAEETTRKIGSYEKTLAPQKDNTTD
jgi:uncharacterized protein (UPF0333 family)